VQQPKPIPILDGNSDPAFRIRGKSQEDNLMPKSAKQRRGEIIYALRGKQQTAMIEAGVECPATRKTYEADLEDLEYLERVPGGWKLTTASKRASVITIQVLPSQNKADVMKGLDAALQQFKPLVTMELEG
jgi:hypothetical protein